MRKDIVEAIEEMQKKGQPDGGQVIRLFGMFRDPGDETVQADLNAAKEALGKVLTAEKISSMDGMILSEELLVYLTLAPCVLSAIQTSSHTLVDQEDGTQYRFCTYTVELDNKERVTLAFCEQSA